MPTQKQIVNQLFAQATTALTNQAIISRDERLKPATPFNFSRLITSLENRPVLNGSGEPVLDEVGDRTIEDVVVGRLFSTGFGVMPKSKMEFRGTKAEIVQAIKDKLDDMEALDVDAMKADLDG